MLGETFFLIILKNVGLSIYKLYRSSICFIIIIIIMITIISVHLQKVAVNEVIIKQMSAHIQHFMTRARLLDRFHKDAIAFAGYMHAVLRVPLLLLLAVVLSCVAARSNLLDVRTSTTAARYS